MAMSVFILLLMAVSFVFGAANGQLEAMGAGLTEGASGAVTLAIAMTGAVCLWCGVVEVMRAAGLMEKLARLFSGPLCLLFPEARRNKELRGNLAAAVSANMLGLGNAATPLSIRACTQLHQLSGSSGTASNSVCMLVVLSACSLQLIPSTVAAARHSAGAANAFDILPAVWVTTAMGCTVGIALALFLGRVWGEEP